MKLITLFILFISVPVTAQNLIKNPSFETTKTCVEEASTFNKNVRNWSIPSLGTTDLFNACSTNGETGIPINFNGYQEAKSGDNYAGIFFYAPKDYREYIQGSFKNPLKKGKAYTISFYINLADKSNFALEKISFMLTQKMIIFPYWTPIMPNKIKNQLTDSFSMNDIVNSNTFDDKNNWTLISKQIIAKGGENYITIGNFKNNVDTKLKKVLGAKKRDICYYYIDMVSVSQNNQTINIDDTNESEIITKNNIELNKKVAFQNINFEFNSFNLSEIAKKEITIIYDYLSANNNTKVAILGHTDALGNDSYNKILSEKRAKSVVTYLIKSGIDKNRIQSFGFGNSQPLSTNKTDEGRQINRRVEFEIQRLVDK